MWILGSLSKEKAFLIAEV